MRKVSLLASLASAALLTACSGGANAPMSDRYATAPPPGTITARSDPAVPVVLTDEDGVRVVRQRLAELNFRVGPASTIWESDAQTAVEAFQRSRGLPAGPLNRTTLNAMGLETVPLTWTGPVVGTSGLAGLPNDADAAPGRVQVGAVVDGGRGAAGALPPVPGAAVGAGGGSLVPAALAPADVREIQQRLRDRGLYAGEIDGIWGPLSRRALSDFQAMNNLPSDGRIDAATARALGLDLQRLGAGGQPGGLQRIGPAGTTSGGVQPSPALETMPGRIAPRP